MKNPLAHYRERNRERLLSDLGAFVRRAWREVEPGKPLLWNWHHELICEYLMLAHAREELRLIFCMPPRGLKSKLISVFFGAWVWAKSPHESFILTSYSDSLSEELNMARRSLLMSAWYQETFPNTVRFSADQNRREQFKNTAGGVSIATSTEGTLTGKGADYLLVDDLLSPQQSYSDLERNNANRFFDSSLRSRLNDPERGVIVVICQRLHERDLPGHLLENEAGAWTLVNLPMEAEQDEDVTFPISGRVVHRKQGDLLHAQRWPESWCRKTKATVGPYIWAGQYGQRPAPAGGAIFKKAWFQEYTELPAKGQTIIALDTAFSVKRSADYSAAAVWVLAEGKYYLAWVMRERLEYPQLKAAVEELAQFWRPESVLIEEKGSGQSLLQSLKQETDLPILGYQVDADKVSRAHGITALFSSGRVFFPKTAPWLAEYLHEMELFPSSAHDDMVDATTMGLAYLRSRRYDGDYGVIELLKRLDKFGLLDPRKPLPRLPKTTEAPKPVIVTRDQAAECSKGHSPPLCPHQDCKHPNTFLQRDAEGVWHIHCKQCRRVDGLDSSVDLLPADRMHCGGRLQIVSGMYKCQNCPKTWPLNGGMPGQPRGVTRAQYAKGVGRLRGQNALSVNTGWKNTFGRFG
jgi:predicted phage terminase large subunit-like protein